MAVTGRFDPRIPPQLRKAGPRMVRGRRYDRLILPAIFMVVGLGVLVAVVAEALFLAVAPITNATITAKYTTSGGKGGIKYHLRYIYGSGTSRITDSGQLSESRYATLQVGDTISIRALGSGSLVRLFCWLWAIGSIGGTLVMMRQLWLLPRQLVRDGQVIIGHITDKKIRRSRSGQTCTLFYEYHPVTGEAIHSKMSMVRGQFNAPEPGSDVVVLYDPAKPKRSIVYDACDFEAI